MLAGVHFTLHLFPSVTFPAELMLDALGIVVSATVEEPLTENPFAPSPLMVRPLKFSVTVTEQLPSDLPVISPEYQGGAEKPDAALTGYSSYWLLTMHE